MQYSTPLVLYILTLILAALVPGPGMTGLMLKTLSQGYRQGVMMLMGLITGDLIFLMISLFLLTSFLRLNENFVFYITLLSCGYLLYLSYQYWHAAEHSWVQNKAKPVGNLRCSYKEGVMITLGNPKTISFYLALVPTIFNPKILQQYGLVLVLTTILVLMCVGGLYIFCAIGLWHKLKNPKMQQLLLKMLAFVMGLLAISMLFTSISRFTATTLSSM